MKIFEIPVVEIKRFDVVDVLTTSYESETSEADTTEPTTTEPSFFGDFCVSA